MSAPAVDFGRDTSCTDVLRPGRLVTGSELVAEAIYRRLTTERGRLIDDPSYGLDVRNLLGASFSPAGLARIPLAVRGEVLKDPRIQGCTVRASQAQVGTASYSLVLDISGSTAAGPFRLVLRVSQVTVERLRP